MTASTPDPQESSTSASSTAATTTPATTAAATPAATPSATPAAAPAQAAPAQAAPAKAAPPPRPPATPRPKSNGSGVAGGAFVTAVCALLVAIGAVGVAVYSLKVARDALSKNADQATALATPATSTDAVPVVTPSAAAPTVSVPQVQYFSELVRAELKIPAPTSCNASYVDVDTMAIGVAAGHEFYLSTCKDPLVPELRVDRTSGASPSSANPNPEVCGALIAGTQNAQELVLTARSGLTFCLLTNRNDANAQNLPQRLAIVEVRDVAVDRTVTIAVSTFRIG
jgi:hypothetical protein